MWYEMAEYIQVEENNSFLGLRASFLTGGLLPPETRVNKIPKNSLSDQEEEDKLAMRSRNSISRLWGPRANGDGVWSVQGEMGANIRIPSPGLSSPICFEQNASAFPSRKSACRDLII